MTFYFYDLETSGVNPREQRIMQFAGQRTNEKLEPIGEVDNILIKLSDDILPDPWAILTHRITPQQANSEGMSEAEFLRWFSDKVATPNTVFTGYNSIRFDDEFMRYLHYRNFYDPYEWQWASGRSKWDLLDVGRMMRALRPDGMEWPFASDGKPSAKLENLTKVNSIEHSDAHKADADVLATIAFASLIQQNQPKLFSYLLDMRDKKKVAKLVSDSQPFVYTSGRYPSEHLKTTVAVSIGNHPEQPGTLLVYDLRHDPSELAGQSADQLAERIFPSRESGLERLPAKTMALNKCPSVAPLGVLDKATQQRLSLDMKVISSNLKKLHSSGAIDTIKDAFSQKHAARQALFITDNQEVDSQLYDGFFNDGDKSHMESVRQADANSLSDLHPDFSDSRLTALLPLYKARNYYSSLTPDESAGWERFKRTRLLAGSPSRVEQFGKQLQKAAEQVSAGSEDEYLLAELQLYVQSILPED